MTTNHDNVSSILADALDGRRLSVEQALHLLEHGDLPSLGHAAHAIRLMKTPPEIATYVVDRNINYTNICECRCYFCAFHRDKDDPGAYVLTYGEIGAKVAETLELGGRQVLLQGGMNPALRLEWYEGLLRHLKDGYGIHNHAFSAPEIAFISRIEDLPIETVLQRLREAGLDSIPGGGAEILSDRVRRRVSPRKCSAEEWIAIHRAAHGLGIRTTATMMFGHLETLEERVEHLDRVRTLQEETGGFTAFIAWPFQPGNTVLADDPDAPITKPAGAHEYLRLMAVARLFIDNIANFQSSWVTQGEQVGQLALRFGCNDLGSTMIEENVVKSAGVSFSLDEKRIRGLIAEAGFRPVRRDFFYHRLED